MLCQPSWAHVTCRIRMWNEIFCGRCCILKAYHLPRWADAFAHHMQGMATTKLSFLRGLYVKQSPVPRMSTLPNSVTQQACQDTLMDLQSFSATAKRASDLSTTSLRLKLGDASIISSATATSIYPAQEKPLQWHQLGLFKKRPLKQNTNGP